MSCEPSPELSRHSYMYETTSRGGNKALSIKLRAYTVFWQSIVPTLSTANKCCMSVLFFFVFLFLVLAAEETSGCVLWVKKDWVLPRRKSVIPGERYTRYMVLDSVMLH